MHFECLTLFAVFILGVALAGTFFSWGTRRRTKLLSWDLADLEDRFSRSQKKAAINTRWDKEAELLALKEKTPTPVASDPWWERFRKSDGLPR